MKKNHAKVFHFDLYGKRENKYDFLLENNIKSINWNELNPNEPYYFFINKNDEGRSGYEDGIKLNELFTLNNVGCVTAHDELNFSYTKKEQLDKLNDILVLDEQTWRLKYNRPKDAQSWKYEWAKNDAIKNIKNDLTKISYRPFDSRWSLYTGNSGGLYARPSTKVMQHFLKGDNVGLVFRRQQPDSRDLYIFCTKNIIADGLIRSDNKGGESTAPLYLYPESSGQQEMGTSPNPSKGGEFKSLNRKPNLNMEIVERIAERLGLAFVAEKGATPVKENATPLNLPKGETLRNENSSQVPPLEGFREVSSLKPGYMTANPISYKFIKDVRDELKSNPTKAEEILWEYLRNKKTGFKIRRQHIIDDFITDFVCLIKKVVIEVDGKIHDNQKEYDEARSQRLSELGFEVIRFTNEQVLNNTEKVVDQIKKYLEEKEETPLNEEESPTKSSPEGKTLGNENSSSQVPPLEGFREVSSLSEVSFAPIDILDYIYAVLHSPTYREKYKEFLKIDFPRVPYPKDAATFWKLVKLGGEIRQIHLLESPIVEKYITQYPIGGDNVVTKPKYQDGKVFINDTQYFGNVPEVAWNFYIGGYQPAQKWLKDRKDRKLEFDDILHYQKIIVALTETDRIMKEIDKIEIE